MENALLDLIDVLIVFAIGFESRTFNKPAKHPGPSVADRSAHNCLLCPVLPQLGGKEP
jgi:hypothetical protein